jgi:serine/threonine protein kinase
VGMDGRRDMPTALRLPDDSMLGHYRIRRLIGGGGFGAVYLAEDRTLGRQVALKVIATDVVGGLGERFLREARRAASIAHPNVIPVYDVGVHDRYAFIATQYVSAISLQQLLAQHGALEPAHAVKILAEVASGLDTAHAAGLVHQDVTPANILVEAPGEPAERSYLIDFGLTRLLADAMAGEAQFVGTPIYSAPELVQGAHVGPYTDTYALGAVLYYMLTGELPFAGKSAAEAMLAHVHAPPPKPSAVRPELGEAFDDVIAAAMAKDPNERPHATSELAARARAVLTGTSRRGSTRGVLGGTIDAGEPATVRERVVSPRFVLVTLASFLLMLVAGSVLALLNAGAIWYYVVAVMIGIGGMFQTFAPGKGFHLDRSPVDWNIGS